jgi:hypothetical protein
MDKDLKREDIVELITSVWQWIVNAVVPFTPDNASTWGQLGDWIGGIGGTLITFASLIALVRTLRISRAAMNRQGIYAVFATMSKTHDDLTRSFQINNSNGTDVFRILLSDFNVCLKATAKHCPDLNTRETVDVAYSLFFYGSTITGRESLKDDYDSAKIDSILDDISITRNACHGATQELKDTD